MIEKLRKRKILVSIIIVLFLVALIFLINVLLGNKDKVKTEGIDLSYRVYTEDGYSDWYKNGEESENKKSILGIEIKINTKTEGHIIYNVYGDKETFEDNDSYDGELAGNKKDKLYGIKIGLTDDLYKKYDIYYRTYNKKDKWLDYTTNYSVSGDNGVNIEKIQIKVIEKDSDFNHKNEKASIGF